MQKLPRTAGPQLRRGRHLGRCLHSSGNANRGSQAGGSSSSLTSQHRDALDGARLQPSVRHACTGGIHPLVGT